MLAAVLFFVLSAIVVDLAGYWLHRWAHRPGSPLYKPHMTHHVTNYPPRAFFSDRYKSSRSDNLALWFAPFGIAYAAVAFLSGVPHPWAIVLGGLLTAVLSSVAHDMTHIRNSAMWRWRLLRGIAVRHHVHHFKMGRNFGIVSPCWDVLFGTRRPSGDTSR